MQQTEKMDRIYRYQRHFYDVSRKYFLFGRDRLLKRMNVQPGERVVEVGCGTARNLFKLAVMAPHAELFGFDASNEMLKTADANRADCPSLQNIQLKQELAENFSYSKTFGLSEPFDKVFCSYSLSMIPTWRQAVDVALKNLKPGGVFYIVDFWDQRDLPPPFRVALTRWLEMFHVKFRPELIAHIQQLESEGQASLQIESVGGRYAYIAELRPLFIPAETETQREAVLV
jgi:S-adenosylmethionine-diacylgycerolhomoserine-N-methlytransferase